MADDEEEEYDTELGFSYGMFKSEGDHFFTRGLTRKAISSYSKALKIQADDAYALTARSRCKLKEGNSQGALDDVNAVLKDDADNYRALYQKAEALYNEGNFETALVYFHRGAQLKPKRQDFKLGILKAEQAIDCAVGDAKSCITTDGDTSFIQKEINDDRNARLKIKPASEGAIKRKKYNEEKDIRPKPPKVSDAPKVRLILGKLYEDRKLLDDVLEEADRTTVSGRLAYNAAWDAASYLDKKIKLWRQYTSFASKSDEPCKQYATATEKIKINKLISRQLERIDRDQAIHMWKESKQKALNLLIELDKFQRGVVNNKETILATINSYIGNALLELNEPRTALDYFKMERSLADQYDIPQSKSRALDNIGRAYARMGWYKKAIRVWNEKLPMAESALERAWLYHEMGRCHHELGNFQRALQLGEKAVTEATSAQDNMWLLNGLTLVAQSAAILNDLKGALEAFYRALEVAILLADEVAEEGIRKAIEELLRRLSEIKAVEDVGGLGVFEAGRLGVEDIGVQTDSKKAAEVRKTLEADKGDEEPAEEEGDDEPVPADVVSKAESYYPMIIDGEVHWVKSPPAQPKDLGDWLRGSASIRDQAFVTLATNDVYAVGALVLAFTLRKSGTQRHLVVMVTTEVSPDMHAVLEMIFDFVFDVWPIYSDDFENLNLLNRSELGVTFTKIHCWRLTQYRKCVFLDADTMVLLNIDDLFDRPELSAAPDAGWPDCFNSGVFVFVPSLDMFNDLLKFAKEIGSFDGGDQGLLNLYFNKWATQDIEKHLPFTYNLVAQAFYSYQPAYKQFGDQTKVVHFIGPRKPWNSPFNVHTCRVEDPDCMCRHMIQLWWDIFMDHIQFRLTRSMHGLTGQLSQLVQLKYVGDKLPLWMGDRGARIRWEANEVDYMGKDSFESIRRRLDEVIRCDAAADSTDFGGDQGDVPKVSILFVDMVTPEDYAERPSCTMMGDSEVDLTESQTCALEAASWQTIPLRHSPPPKSDHCVADDSEVDEPATLQTDPLRHSPPPTVTDFDIPAEVDLGTLVQSQFDMTPGADEPTESQVDMTTASKWMTRPDKPWTPPPRLD